MLIHLQRLRISVVEESLYLTTMGIWVTYGCYLLDATYEYCYCFDHLRKLTTNFFCSNGQTIAAAIVVGIILHAGNHLVCDFPRLINSPNEKYAPLGQYFGEIKPTYFTLVKGVEGITGVIMVICMVIAFTLATRWFRRSLVKLPKPFDKLTGFNAFWYSHHLFIIVYLALIVHGQCLYLIHVWHRKTVRFYLFVFILCTWNNWSLSPKVFVFVFVFDTDMDVSGSACLLVCRGESAKVFQVWQLFCQATEGQ